MFTDTKTPILSSAELARLRDPALYMVSEGAENTWDVVHREAQVEFRVWRLDAPGTVAVDGSLNGGGVYTVRLGSRPELHGCTCMDHQRRGRVCKHIAASVSVAAHCAARRVLARLA